MMDDCDPRASPETPAATSHKAVTRLEINKEKWNGYSER